MNRNVQGMAPNTTVVDAINAMLTNKQSCVLVTEQNRLVGILTERDVVTFIKSFLSELNDEALAQKVIAEIMSDDPICVSDEDELSDVIFLAENLRIRHFPVVDSDEKLVGLVTQSDIMHAYRQMVLEQKALKQSNQLLQSMALEDELMKIGNRRAMELDLKHCHHLAQRNEKNYSVCIVDVDFFKKYNDLYGHLAGDKALKMLAKTIKKTLRQSDRLYRYGGEEILILMPDTELKAAIDVAERVRLAVQNLAIEHQQSPLGTLSISGGVAVSNDANWIEIVGDADKALYRAKQSGRNRICS